MSEENIRKRFDVALSFPGERRRFIQKVAEALAQQLHQEQVFYDKWYEAELARVNLDVYLQSIYRDEAELIVVFLCAEYEQKEWCGLEWRAIRDLIKQKHDKKIMLFRFDETVIPGLFSVDGYVDVKRQTAVDVGKLIIERLYLNRQTTSPPPRVLLDTAEIQREQQRQEKEQEKEQTDFPLFRLEGMDKLFGAAPPLIQQPQPIRGDDLRLDLRLEFREAIFGAEKTISFSHLETCGSCVGKGFHENLQGHISCANCNQRGLIQIAKKLQITIPAGVDHGTRLLVSGEGDAGRYEGEAGDLYVYLSVNEDKQFKRDGIDLLSNVEISAEQATSGCKLQINAIKGSCTILIPEMTKHKTVFRVSNFGVPKLGNQTQRGDHLVTILITDSTPDQSAAQGFLSFLDWIPDFTFLDKILTFWTGTDVILTQFQHQFLKVAVLSTVGLAALISIGQDTPKYSPSLNLSSPEVSRPTTTSKP